MKWLAILSLALAIVVRLAWHSKIDLAFPINATTHRGYPVSLIAFWFLLIISLTLASMALLKRSH